MGGWIPLITLSYFEHNDFPLSKNPLENIYSSSWSSMDVFVGSLVLLFFFRILLDGTSYFCPCNARIFANLRSYKELGTLEKNTEWPNGHLQENRSYPESPQDLGVL